MEAIEITPELTKSEVFVKVRDFLEKKGLKISKVDHERPWGGFFVLDETQIKEFKDEFFAEVDLSEDQMKQKLSPKFLLVASGARLSWQYHFRRAELWKLIAGKAGIVRSLTDEEGDVAAMEPGKTVSLSKGERHRLVGTENWGIVAEIWMHADPSNPSDEEDIVRLADDYARN